MTMRSSSPRRAEASGNKKLADISSREQYFSAINFHWSMLDDAISACRPSIDRGRYDGKDNPPAQIVEQTISYYRSIGQRAGSNIVTDDGALIS